jgi:hypothetical protein
MRKPTFWLAGLLSGAFIGSLIGLSSSPVVGTAITAIVPVALIVASGFAGKDGQKPIIPIENALSFVITFFLIALICVLTTAYIRQRTTQSAASGMYENLRRIGLTEEEAKKGTLDWLLKDGNNINPVIPFLYSSESQECSNFTVNEDTGITDQQVEAMRSVKGWWSEFADVVDELEEIQSIELLTKVKIESSFYRILCE